MQRMADDELDELSELLLLREDWLFDELLLLLLKLELTDPPRQALLH